MIMLIQIGAIVIPLGLLYIFYTLYQKWGRPAGFPSGPPILPLVGSLPFLLKKSPSLLLTDWRSKYGSIIGLKLGPINAVVLSDLDDIKKIFNVNVTVSLQIPKSVEKIITDGREGIIHFEGKGWMEHRIFAIKNLRDLGTRKKTHEAMVLEDIQDLLEILKKHSGQSVDPTNILGYSILNSLWHVLAGKRFELTDPKFQDIADKLVDAISSGLDGVIPVLFPWLAAMFPKWSGLTHIRKAYNDVYEVIQNEIDEHKETYQGDNLRDYMDAYLHEIESATDPKSTFYGKTGSAHMLFWIFTLFATGIETTRMTLVWAFYLLMKNPKVQKKLQEEINTVVGTARFPSLSDRSNMPYAEAIMMEIYRVSSIAPLGIPHFTMEDINFRGYKFPKGTPIFGNIYAFHFDENTWGDPYNFRPERFLEANGNRPPIIPFSVGKKSCPGETLARNNVFLFVTSIFQQFSVTGDPSSKFEEKSCILLRGPPNGKYIFQEQSN